MKGNQPFLEYPRVLGHELAAYVAEATEGSRVPVRPVGNRQSLHRLSVNATPVERAFRTLACISACSASIATAACARRSAFRRKTSLRLADCRQMKPRASSFSRSAPTRCAAAEFNGGERALVVGAGPIGLGVALFARLAGAAVTVMDREAERLGFAPRYCGRSIRPCSPRTTWPVWSRGRRKATASTSCSTPRATRLRWRRAFPSPPTAGDTLLVGLVKDTISFFDPDFHKREMTLLASRNATLEDFETVMSAIQGGDVPIDRLITHRTISTPWSPICRDGRARRRV